MLHPESPLETRTNISLQDPKVGAQSVAEQLRTIAGEDFMNCVDSPAFHGKENLAFCCARQDCHIVCGDADHDFNFPETCATALNSFASFAA